VESASSGDGGSAIFSSPANVLTADYRETPTLCPYFRLAAESIGLPVHLKYSFILTVTAFYERGCQEKYFGDDRTMIGYPAHTVMERCGFRFSADSSPSPR
jgi:hypothetical protein